MSEQNLAVIQEAAAATLTRLRQQLAETQQHRDGAIEAAERALASLLVAHQQLDDAREEVVRLAAGIAALQTLLAEVWAAATDDTLPFYQRLPALRHLVPRVAPFLAGEKPEKR